MAAQLKEIVDRLNAEPFNLDLSLLVFDEKDVRRVIFLPISWWGVDCLPILHLAGPLGAHGDSEESLDILRPKT